MTFKTMKPVPFSTIALLTLFAACTPEPQSGTTQLKIADADGNLLEGHYPAEDDSFDMMTFQVDLLSDTSTFPLQIDGFVHFDGATSIEYEIARPGIPTE
jgi:hypothetical protein